MTINYGLGDGTGKTQQMSVPADSRTTVNPKDVLGTGDDTSHDFSAKVESTNNQPLVVERPMYFNYKPGVLDWNGGHDVMGTTTPGTQWYFAEGTVRPGFDTYFTIQNTGIDKANVGLAYSTGDGRTVTDSVSVLPNSRATVNPRDKLGTGDDPAHDFSTRVVSENGQLLVVERPMYFNYKPGVLNWNGGHNVMGAKAPANAWYFAEGTVRPGFDPYFTVQNTGSSEAAVKVTYGLGDGTTETQDVVVPADTRGTVDPKAVLGTGDDASHDFSAKVESTNDQPLVVERPMYFNYKPGVCNWNGGHNVMGAVDAASVWYFAEGTCRPGFDPYITIQNIGESATTVSLEYMTGTGQKVNDQVTVPPHSRATVEPRAKLGTADDAAHDFSTKAVSGGQLLVVERPMYFNYKPGVLNWNGGHNVMGFH